MQYDRREKKSYHKQSSGVVDTAVQATGGLWIYIQRTMFQWMDRWCVSKANPSYKHSAPQISNMRLSFKCFLMTKRHITDHILDRSELFQEHAKKNH